MTELWIGELVSVETLWSRLGQTPPKDYQYDDFFADYTYEITEYVHYKLGNFTNVPDHVTKMADEYITDLPAFEEGLKKFEGLDTITIGVDQMEDRPLLVGRKLTSGVSPSEIASVTEELVKLGIVRSTIAVHVVMEDLY